jgi:arginine/serine-rich splicing factor 16
MARGLSEAQGLQVVEQESLERRAQQHAALQAAQDAVYHNPKPGGVAAVNTTGPGTSGPGGLPTGSGVYSAIGFSYDAGAGAVGGAAAVGAGAISSDSSSDSDSDSDTDSEDGAGLGPVSEADLAQEAEDDRVDEMAEVFGLEDFSYRLHKALQKEGEEEARVRNAPRWGGLGRKCCCADRLHACCVQQEPCLLGA